MTSHSCDDVLQHSDFMTYSKTNICKENYKESLIYEEEESPFFKE